jgi:Fe2+ transport system protein FeoA
MPMFFSFIGGGGRRQGLGKGRGPGRRHRHRRGWTEGLTLADLESGKTFRVLRIAATGEIRQRLTDMGFIRGATGRILREALLRDPIELEMLGYKISLRRAEAREIAVEEVE